MLHAAAERGHHDTLKILLDNEVLKGMINACDERVSLFNLTLSVVTEQYCAAGAILKPLCLSKLLTLL